MYKILLFFPSPSFPTLASPSIETESYATDYITTPPTSPQRAQQLFQQMMSSPPFLSNPSQASTSSKTSPVALGSMLASVKLASESSPSLTPTVSLTPSQEDRSFPSPSLYTSPVSKARPPFVQSLSAKRPRQVPGTLDLSSLPQFPQHPSLHLTPQDSEISGSTPRAVAERPGLFSRWSSDSECVSSCTSSDCEESIAEEEQEAVDGDDDADGADAEHEEENEFGSSKRPTISQRSATMKRSTSIGQNPFFLSPSISIDPIPSPVPVSSPHAVSSLLPPAPKPHQHGFSPYAEEQGFMFSGPSASVSSPLAQLSATSPSALHSRRKKRSHHHKHRSNKQGGSDAGFQDSSDSTKGISPSGTPSADSSTTTTRLTRSQGLRIKDQGDKPRGRYARALSQQLRHGADGLSSPIKTANALLDGTISPAETTTDPLRVKLREMPGAKTPDGTIPSSPSSHTSPRQSSHHPHSHHLRPSVGRSYSSPKLHASSPLHLTSYPGEANNNNNNSGKDTKRDVFNSAFSFAATRESSARSPLAMKSPLKSPMGTIREDVPDSNPYFAGYA